MKESALEMNERADGDLSKQRESKMDGTKRETMQAAEVTAD